MKLYKISQKAVTGYDTFDSAIVAAEDEDDARIIHPSNSFCPMGPRSWDGNATSTWADATDVAVEYLGEAKSGLQRGVVCSSFHAG